jgi:hypothetical protein
MPDPSMLPPSLPSESSEPTPKEVEWMSYVLREHARLHRDAADAQPTPEMEAQCLREAEVSEWLASHLPEMVEALADRERLRNANDGLMILLATAMCELGAPDPRMGSLARADIPDVVRAGATGEDFELPEPRKLTLQEAAKIVVRVLRPAAARVRPEPPTRETSNG